jgi:ribosome biogenesis GTPase / thiamine phosphate phosphatase
MDLTDLGYKKNPGEYTAEEIGGDFILARVLAEYRELYIVSTGKGEFEAEITGNMRFTAASREDFPVVGDWVLIKIYEPDLAIIHRILPRYSLIKRQNPGGNSGVQPIAANVDYAFIVQSAGRDFNINRLERYLTICYDSDIRPVIILSKTDLLQAREIENLSTAITQRIKDVPVIKLSNVNREGYDKAVLYLKKGVTCCMLGSSGAGKSTFLNNISGQQLMKTGDIGLHSNRGRHVTSHRELFVLDNGGILIDNPGIRELGIADAGRGMERTFDSIAMLSQECRYKDCTHTGEDGCAVTKAVERGELDADTYANFIKMEKEREHYLSTLAERRQKEKQFGKVLRNYKKDSKKNDWI